ncbi:MAG: cytochrome P460 family protein [Alphaproteobacteria bacterium]
MELTDAEAASAYDCVIRELRAAYSKSGADTAKNYANWRRYSRVAYTSGTHGNRFVQNYANATAKAYGAFENAGVMPVGSILAKDSFTVDGKGRIGIGPLFLMEKMPTGFKEESGDWKYSMVMPTGAVAGVTNGKNATAMNVCHECHMSVAEDQDSMMFLPEEYRAK